MKLVSLSVEKYRSILQAHKVSLSQSVVLLGPNNEGKSNIVRALSIGMTALSRVRMLGDRGDRIFASWRAGSIGYDWDRDFPMQLQAKEPNGESVIVLEFSLDKAEIEEFWQQIKSRLNGKLSVKIIFGQSRLDIKVLKKGKGAKTFLQKSAKIAGFVAKRLEFEHIPAVRTAGSAKEIVDELVRKELSKLDSNEVFVQALKKISELQQPLLNELAKSMKDTLVQFLPSVKSVRIEMSPESRYRALRQCDIIIDDGSPTTLELKGDGVQSLAALAIMRNARERGSAGKNLVVAIEEPESHLHPGAIHQLRTVIKELSQKHQLVVTTHHPLFANRESIRANIIVKDSKARPASGISEVRNVLGVRAADNLMHAELVLLVEGEDDKISLTGLICYASPTIKQAITQGTLAVDSLVGGSNLCYKIGIYSTALCKIQCFLDNDDTGRAAVDRALREGLLRDHEYSLATCPGRTDSEIEDLYAEALYLPILKDKYGVILHSNIDSKLKWSNRMKQGFVTAGKRWDDSVCSTLKYDVALAASQHPENALHPEKRGPIDTLVRAIETKLKK